MSRPAEAADFTTRLDWLLATVPRVPGTAARFTIDDVVAVLAVAAAPAWPAVSTTTAREWLTAIGAGGSVTTDPRSARYLPVLETLLRLPAGYFTSAAIRRATDERIAFAAASTTMAVRVIGPCRVSATEVSAHELHVLYHHGRAAAGRHRHGPGSTE